LLQSLVVPRSVGRNLQSLREVLVEALEGVLGDGRPMRFEQVRHFAHICTATREYQLSRCIAYAADVLAPPGDAFSKVAELPIPVVVAAYIHTQHMRSAVVAKKLASVSDPLGGPGIGVRCQVACSPDEPGDALDTRSTAARGSNFGEPLI